MCLSSGGSVGIRDQETEQVGCRGAVVNLGKGMQGPDLLLLLWYSLCKFEISSKYTAFKTKQKPGWDAEAEPGSDPGQRVTRAPQFPPL